MKIKRIKLLTSFRGLPAGYELVLMNDSTDNIQRINPICFVGLNGSGKSNVLELIAELFYYLENYQKISKSRDFNSNLGFEIDYILPRQYLISIRISWPEFNSILNSTQIDPIIKISKDIDLSLKADVYIEDHVLQTENNNYIQSLLPSRIIAYSSGLNELLSNPFIKMDFNYYDDLKSKLEIENLTMNRMFFLNYKSNKFIAISNFLFDADDYDMSSFDKNQKATDFGGIDLSILKKELSLKNLKSFVVKFRFKKSVNENEYLHTELNIALDKLKKCATFINEYEKKTKNNTFLDIELIYWVNTSTKAAFRHYFKTSYELFRVFYFFELLNNKLMSKNIRKNIVSSKVGTYENLSDELPKYDDSQLVFVISDVIFQKKNNSTLYYRNLSDGEHQFLQIFGSLLLMDNLGSLFLLDEPDTHFNPDWRSKFVSIINQLIEIERGQEIILTTHSPYIVSDCKKDNVFIFQRNSSGIVSQPKTPNINTFGTSVSILSSEIFGKDNTISDFSKEKIDEIRKMPLNTIDNIKKAKESSRVLGESIEKVLLFKDLISRERELEE